jgi:hypothetical protein
VISILFLLLKCSKQRVIEAGWGLRININKLYIPKVRATLLSTLFHTEPSFVAAAFVDRSLALNPTLSL